MNPIQTKSSFRRARGQVIVITVVALGALAIRLVHLDAESLWMDELVTVQTYHLDPAGVVRAAAIEGQPPLDNCIGAALARIRLAESDWWVRFPAAVFGAGSVLLLGLLLGSFAGPVAGIAASLLLAVCPIHLYMSQEARPYTLMFFLALASVLAFRRARNRNTATSWTLFAVTVFLMLMTRWTDPHFIVLGLAVCAFGVRRSSIQFDDEAARRHEASRFRRTTISLFAAYLLYAPFFAVVLQQSRRAIGFTSGDWIGRVGVQLSQGFAALFAGYSTRTVFNALPDATWLILLGGVFTLAGACILLARAARRRDGGGLFLSVFLTFPFVYAVVYAFLGNAVPKPQYMLIGAVATFGCIAVVIDEIRRRVDTRNRALGAAAFVIAIGVFALPMARASLEGLQRIDKRDWRGAMGYLKTHARPGDVAVTAASDTVPPTFAPMAYGKNRYGAEFLKFVPIALATTLDAFDADGWHSHENTVWLLVYTDRMYLGFDQVPPPSRVGSAHPTTMKVHAFNGLFLVEVYGSQPAIDRLMDGIAALYEDLPDGRSLIAPAVLRSRWLMSRRDTPAAKAALDVALRQCRSQNEALILRRDVFASTPPLPASLASTP
ncbi:MAG: glycosyltransferase family 39 protein [Phycisphaerales bacterium]|nr:glycosyltransferase family 39 protein [Phycisphaerales bacterium]